MLYNERLTRTLVILGIFCAVVYLGEFLWRIGQGLSDLILLLAMAWLVAYVLRPIAQWLDRQRIPRPVLERIRNRWGDRVADRLHARVCIPYWLAALSLYLLVLLSLALTIVLILPGIIKQSVQLANQLPDYIQQAPDWWEGIQDQIVERFNVDRERLAEVVPVNDFVQEATSVLPNVIENGISVLRGVAAGVANTLLVLILSLYIMLDGKRLSEQFNRLVPLRYQDEFQFVFSTIDRTFGGFLRGQVLMALIQGVFTGVVMRLFGLQFTMITAILSGVLMFIPELGAPLAMLAPSIASTLQGSDATFPLLIIMLTFQQILLRFVIPKIMSEAIGMPPLLILVSVLISAKVMGFWGFFFGIPVAGAIYTIVVVTLEEVKQTADAQDKQRQSQEKPGEATTGGQ
jgi:predicted PurR-regulated permease PerM